MDIHDRLLNEREKMTSRRYSGHAPCQRDFLTSYSSATRHEWLNLFSSRHECFTSDSGLTRTRLVSCVFLTSLMPNWREILHRYGNGCQPAGLHDHAILKLDLWSFLVGGYFLDSEGGSSMFPDYFFWRSRNSNLLQ